MKNMVLGGHREPASSSDCDDILCRLAYKTSPPICLMFVVDWRATGAHRKCVVEESYKQRTLVRQH